MKFILFFTFFILNLFFCQANDTLTRAQVYNFNVGDTFDYSWNQYNQDDPNSYTSGYQRIVVTGVQLSDSTLYINEMIVYPEPAQPTSLILSNLNDYEIYLDSSIGCQYSIEDSPFTSYSGRAVNGIAYFTEFAVTRVAYGEGLGEVNSSAVPQNPDADPNPPPPIESSNQLIYYSKSGEIWGTPIFNGGSLIHYTPLPEECATWIDKIYSDFMDIPPHVVWVKEQIRSGNKIPYQGHNYIEMIYSSYDYTTGGFTDDSLIGYYRNDTVNKLALFYQDTSDSPFFEYDFNIQCAPPNCMTQVMVGGQLRTEWPGYIEGVGGINGLITVKQFTYNYGPDAPNGVYPTFFTCFNVCGQTLYPDSTLTDCSLVTGINQFEKQIFISVFPTVNSGDFEVVTEDETEKMQLTLYDVFGRLVKVENIYGGKNNIHVYDLSSGIYFWNVTSSNQSIRSGKIIIEK